MEQAIRCIRERDFNAIKDGQFVRNGQGISVCVFYGYNNYHDNPAHVSSLAHIARTETNVDEQDMHVIRISREESIRHANHTMVQVAIDVERVKNNLNNYTIL